MQRSIFEELTPQGVAPLAEQARPQVLDDILGHDKLLGEGLALRVMIDNDSYSSFILWGPPGSGKTTIARYIEKNTDNNFCFFSAVLSKIADVKNLMQKARQIHHQQGRSTLVFVDEIHRFNKSQQDAFLPFVESGAVILIGATTENPSFEVIAALLSRCHVFVLEPLAEAALLTILQRAVTFLGKKVEITVEALQLLSKKAGGDARRALNDLELISRNAEHGDRICPELVTKLLSKKSLFYDKAGEEHFNLISAFQKSIRGSDPQAALYWLARMVEAGEDPLYITRRLVRIASEDVGLADPQAIVQAMAVKDAVHFLGLPEANTALSQLTVYLATAPKSNALELAYQKAKKDALATSHLKVPLSIRNAPTSLMRELGYNKQYRYSHNYQHSYNYQKYFPESMSENEYYRPSSFGFEKDIEKRLEWWKQLKEEQLRREKDREEKS
jgi:putative ATPase